MEKHEVDKICEAIFNLKRAVSAVHQSAKCEVAVDVLTREILNYVPPYSNSNIIFSPPGKIANICGVPITTIQEPT